MPSDNSCHHWFLRVCNKRNTFCSWRNKATTVFFGGGVQRVCNKETAAKTRCK